MRISVFVLLATGSSVWLIALCITAMNVVAWTGYAGMRAEVAAVTDGAGGLTWYGTIVAAVEAIGIAAGAMLPTGASGRPSDTVLVVVTARLCGCARPHPGGCGRLAGPARRTDLTSCRHDREAERRDGARRLAHAGRLGTDAARRCPGRGAARACCGGSCRNRLHPRFAARPGRCDLPGAARTQRARLVAAPGVRHGGRLGARPGVDRVAVRGPGAVRPVHDDPRGTARHHGVAATSRRGDRRPGPVDGGPGARFLRRHSASPARRRRGRVVPLERCDCRCSRGSRRGRPCLASRSGSRGCRRSACPTRCRAGWAHLPPSLDPEGLRLVLTL